MGSSLLGVLFAVIISYSFSNITCSEISKYLILIADACIRIFQMIITPFIFFGSIVFIYSRFYNNTNAKYEIVKNKFMLPLILLAAIGLSSLRMESLVNAFRNFDLDNIFKQPVDISSLVTLIVPKSIFESLSQNNIIQVLVFSAFFGLAAASLKSNSKPIIESIYTAYSIMCKMLQSLFYLVPVILFCAIAAILLFKKTD